MSSAAEARFRIPAPASVSRLVNVIAIDPSCDDVVARLAEGSWSDVMFFPAAAVADRIGRVVDDVVDLVVMVVSAGADASAAALVGRACSDRRVHTATFIVGASRAGDEALLKTLEQVRPWSLMVVIAGDDGYVEDILRSFR